MTQEGLAFGPFLESLEHRLDELPAEQLRRVLLEHGVRRPADERVGFLHVFDTSGTATGQDGPDLQGDVESFVADITNGAYAEGYGVDSATGSTGRSVTRAGRSRWTTCSTGRARRSSRVRRRRPGGPTGCCWRAVTR